MGENSDLNTGSAFITFHRTKLFHFTFGSFLTKGSTNFARSD